MIYSSDVRLPSFHMFHQYGSFSQLNGIIPYGKGYRIFYQYCLTESQYGTMSLGYQQSEDLVYWEKHNLAVTPRLPYSKDGCLGGCAVGLGGSHIVLYYTGNRYLNRGDVPQQSDCTIMIAVTRDGTVFTQNTVNLRESERDFYFCDPKVFFYGTRWWMLVGGCNHKQEGEIRLYSSTNHFDWYFENVLFKSIDGQEGFFWGNPDLFKLADKWVLSFTKVDRRGDVSFTRSGYIIGEWLVEEGKFYPETRFTEYDVGVDFYAPKVMQHNEKQIMIGSMFSPNRNPVSLPISFSQYTLVREITLNKNKDRLMQKPILTVGDEDKLLTRCVLLDNEEKAITKINFRGKYVSLGFMLSDRCEQIGLRLGDKFKVYYDSFAKQIVVERDYPEHRMVDRRTVDVPIDKFQMYIHLFIDSSSVEIFDDSLSNVFTYQFFPSKKENNLKLFSWGGLATLLIDVYQINQT